MPAIQRLIPSRSTEFWDALDPDDAKQVLDAVKEEFNRPEPAHELHYFGAMSIDGPVGFSQSCFRDCLVFLLRGNFIIEGRGRAIDTGCAYRIKDEIWLWLGDKTTIVVMEEGDQKGACLRATAEKQRGQPRRHRRQSWTFWRK